MAKYLTVENVKHRTIFLKHPVSRLASSSGHPAAHKTQLQSCHDEENVTATHTHVHTPGNPRLNILAKNINTKNSSLFFQSEILQNYGIRLFALFALPLLRKIYVRICKNTEVF